jgi:glycerol-3-phosphate dehydrogenase
LNGRGASDRDDALKRLAGERFDVLVIGGGATGLGAAVDAAARGYRTALIEANDFAAATSSRSTKLVHGGVRYLQQGNIPLVREALHERAVLRRNAPHVVRDLTFVIPAYRWYEVPYYAAGLAAYDLLAGHSEFAPSRVASATRARELIPGLQAHRLRGAVVYHDGQFDDARLAIALARTAADGGAAVANYVRATGFVDDARGHVAGVTAVDLESGAEFVVRGRAIINATGIFVDAVRALDEPNTTPLLAHSRGSHVVVRAEALGGASAARGAVPAALLVPKTSDGRVVFALPWADHVVIGTTDVPVERPELDPHASAQEIAYIFDTVNRFLTVPLAPRDIVATFAGLRPLIRGCSATTATAKLSREHLVEVARSGLVTVAGGKWTTYRTMAADAVDAAARTAGLTPAPSQTEFMPLHGAIAREARDARDADDDAEHLHAYGSDAREIVRIAAGDEALRERLDPRLPYTGAEVVYAVRAEMARTVEDVLARRLRALFLDADAALAAAPRAATLLAAELGRHPAWAAEQVAAFSVVAARRRASTSSA